jgi:hypothetical protein
MPTPERSLTVAVLGLWSLLMLLAVGSPALLASVNPGDDRVRYTVRVTLLFYGLAAALLLSADQTDQSLRLTRWLWTLSLAAYLVHVALAFHYYHNWSNADAYARTERITGFGFGIYISHLFGLLWTLDVAWWWLAPVSHARRWPWLSRLLHAFLAFIIFNGAVIFAEGVVRWASLLMFLALAGLLLRKSLQPGPIAGIPRET